FTTYPPTVGKRYNASVLVLLNGIPEVDAYGRICTIETVAQGLRPTAAIKQTFKATAYPNPFANNFMLDVKTSSQSAVNLKVYDMIGRLIEQREVRVSDLETATIGDSYPSGVYNVVVSQEDDIQTVRVVKR
ncbi:T9SS type A sorting domain-containing protein, partial [Flavobacterium paronense]